VPKRATPFDDKRARIAALAQAPPAAAVPELRRFLAERNGYLVGEAAAVAAGLELRELIPDLAAALRRLLDEGAAADKGCFGKKHVLETLLGFEADEREVYLAALRYTQEEPDFRFHKSDTAGPLRGLAAHALVQIDYPAALAEITPLLVDPEPVARAEAAQAIGRSGLEGAGAVLHLKVLSGQDEPDVIQGAYAGLLRLDARRYLPVAAAALRAGGPGADAVALALGESRLREAFPVLKDALLGPVGVREQGTLLMAIALLRSDEAIDLLVSRVAEAKEAEAVAALAALALHRHDPKIAARARDAATARGTRRLLEALREHLG
jgi:HEAT repeat protein